MSLLYPIGPAPNILQPSAQFVHRPFLPQPILSLPDLHALKHTTHRGWKTKVIDCSFDYLEGPSGMEPALGRISTEAYGAASSGYQLIVLCDRAYGPSRVPVSILLALEAVRRHLIETRQRKKVGIILETAQVTEVRHMCVLLGYGADAICPYLAFELAFSLRTKNILDPSFTNEDIYQAYQGAIVTGQAKMGISTLQSYKSAQIFEAVGLCQGFIDNCFRGTQSRIGWQPAPFGVSGAGPSMPAMRAGSMEPLPPAHTPIFEHKKHRLSRLLDKLAVQLNNNNKYPTPSWLVHDSRGHDEAPLDLSVKSPRETTGLFSCDACGQEFSIYDRLVKHIASRHRSKPEGVRAYACEVCFRKFARSDMLTRHARLHSGVKPYGCASCGQVFSRSDHLATHQRTHTGEKPYRCPACPYAACRRDMITRHMRTHNRRPLPA